MKVNLIQLLSIFESGSLSIRIDGFSFFKVDAQSRIIVVEANEMKEYGLSFSKLTEFQSGQKGWISMVKGTISIAKELHTKGWVLKLYDGKGCIVAMGKGVSRLTGYIRLNPLKIRRILKYL